VALREIVFGQSLGRTLIRGLAIGLLLLVISKTFVIPIRASGISMQPTFEDGQLLFFNAMAYRLGEPSRGDVVVITMDARDAVLVKRVIGLPGERIRIDGGQVVVNDVPLAEPYVQKKSAWQVDELVLAPDEFFVIGDNRSMAQRHHTFGAVTRDRLYARLMF
jgi:signal peptidase I